MRVISKGLRRRLLSLNNMAPSELSENFLNLRNRPLIALAGITLRANTHASLLHINTTSLTMAFCLGGMDSKRASEQRGVSHLWSRTMTLKSPWLALMSRFVSEPLSSSQVRIDSGKDVDE